MTAVSLIPPDVRERQTQTSHWLTDTVSWMQTLSERERVWKGTGKLELANEWVQKWKTAFSFRVNVLYLLVSPSPPLYSSYSPVRLSESLYVRVFKICFFYLLPFSCGPTTRHFYFHFSMFFLFGLVVVIAVVPSNFGRLSSFIITFFARHPSVHRRRCCWLHFQVQG